MVCGAISVVLSSRFVWTVKNERQTCRDKVRMLELTIYGLVGLAAMLVIAFYFAYADEFSSAREKSSFDLINNPQLSDTQMIGSGPKSSPHV
jgi:hypothetical protein